MKQINAWRVDLKPKPAALNRRKAANELRADAVAKCTELARYLAAGQPADELVLQACMQLVQAGILEEGDFE